MDGSRFKVIDPGRFKWLEIRSMNSGGSEPLPFEKRAGREPTGHPIAQALPPSLRKDTPNGPNVNGRGVIHPGAQYLDDEDAQTGQNMSKYHWPPNNSNQKIAWEQDMTQACFNVLESQHVSTTQPNAASGARYQRVQTSTAMSKMSKLGPLD